MKIVPPPYRIKVVEPLEMTNRAEREAYLEEAGYNPFLLPSKAVYIDLLTDSGTGSMSDNQWAGMMIGDEAYAGSNNFYHLQETIEEIMGFRHVIPTHQGRGAENILFTVMLKEGDIVPNNMHFDTTKAHVQYRKAKALDLVIDEAYDPSSQHPFKGDMNTEKLREVLTRDGDRIPLVMMTVTCNSGGGQPVSMANLREVSEIAKAFGKPLYIDSARFAENAYFIKLREEGYQDKAIAEIVKEMFSYADGATMSGKKDALVNIGGFAAFKDEEMYRKSTVWAVFFEGFPTYGGLAGRDLEAMARGLKEVLDFDYLAYRTGQIKYLADRLLEAGVPIMEPAGGHAVYLDALRFLPDMPREHFPAFALTSALYLEGGIRAVEIGSVLAGRDQETNENVYSSLELVRLTIPRRTYTERHLDAIADAVISLYQNPTRVKGLKFIYEPPVLRHFTARFNYV